MRCMRGQARDALARADARAVDAAGTRYRTSVALRVEKISATGSGVFASDVRTAAVQLGGRRAATPEHSVMRETSASANTNKKHGKIKRRAHDVCTRCSPSTANTRSERTHEQGELCLCCVGWRVRAGGWFS
jgi:hypothetical protein